MRQMPAQKLRIGRPVDNKGAILAQIRRCALGFRRRFRLPPDSSAIMRIAPDVVSSTSCRMFQHFSMDTIDELSQAG